MCVDQGIMHEAVGTVSHWSQLWSWDVSLSTPVGHAPPKQVCVRLFVTDRQTHMTAPAGEAFCRQFADLEKQVHRIFSSISAATNPMR